MRKILGASLMLILIAFTACGNKSTNKAEQDVKETKTNNIQTNETKQMGTIKLTKAEFLQKVANYETSPTEWKYLGDKPCIIDFYADWCGPCKAIAPVLEELAKEYDGQIYIYKVDTEKEQELAAAFGIRSIPSLLFCPIGEQPQMAQGALPKETFKKAIDEVLLKKTK
ncbi:MAG: thioredoxin [Paludibacter sp.]|nr:thioredoxin [Paludibacter sp.]MDD4198348.1 thioredoxin [Paludibacter sp.]MDD4428324.1 thioredoxin [Paludibacter sp.]